MPTSLPTRFGPRLLGSFLLALCWAHPALGQARPHDIPPVGVMGATHPGAHGQMTGMSHEGMSPMSDRAPIMLSYSFMRMNMEGSLTKKLHMVK